MKKRILLNFGHNFFSFFLNANNPMLLNYLRNSSWKLEVPSLKNVGGDRFEVFIQISEKIDNEKIAIHMFVHETFYKTDYISKIK